MSITKNLNHLYRNISNDIVVVAVSKTKPNEDILEAYNSGHKSFGENKVQELIEKHNALPKDIEWHFIGHLQRNKVKNIIKFIHLIHSVDSYKLLNEINKRAKNENRVVDCLIQVKIATEENKYGFNFEEIDDVINFSKNLDHINVKGFMGMSTLTNDNNIINNEFSKLQNIFNNYKSKTLNILSRKNKEIFIFN